MDNYRVIPLGGSEQIEISGVRFDNGKNFMYWKKRNNIPIREVSVIFSKEQENVMVRDGLVVLSLKGLNNYQDIYNAVNIFRSILGNKDIKFHFIISNENEKKVAEALGNNLGISYEILDVNRRINNANKKVGAVEEKLENNDKNYSASGSKTIEVQKNTGIEKITVSDNKAYVNSGNLSIEEQKYLLLQEWKKDPFMSRRMNDLTEEEIDRLLTEEVTYNLTQYRMESAREQVASDDKGKVAMDKSTKEDGLVNPELGIVENHVSNSNQYSVVEERGDSVQIVNPSVTNSSINSGGVNGTVTGNNESQEYVDSSLKEEEEQPRNLEDQVFYLDEEFNIYDMDANRLGKVGQDGYSINYEDNTILKNGQPIGYIGDYKNMERDSNIYSKPNVRTLKKKTEMSSSEMKSAAFVSLPVIIFIISALLLISSVVLLFVLD